MRITDALTADHQVLRDLLTQGETDPAKAREAITRLVIHHTLEEKFFYDVLAQVAQAEHDAVEAVNEHHIIELIIKDFEAAPEDHAVFGVKLEGLAEYTRHHLDEEELEIFPLANQLLASAQLDDLGARFEYWKRAKAELEASLAAEAVGGPMAGASGSGMGRGLGIGSLK